MGFYNWQLYLTYPGMAGLYARCKCKRACARSANITTSRCAAASDVCYAMQTSSVVLPV